MAAFLPTLQEIAESRGENAHRTADAWAAILAAVETKALPRDFCTEESEIFTLMHLAASKGDAAIVRRLIALGVLPSVQPGDVLRTPMRVAVFSNNWAHMLEICKALPATDIWRTDDKKWYTTPVGHVCWRTWRLGVTLWLAPDNQNIYDACDNTCTWMLAQPESLLALKTVRQGLKSFLEEKDLDDIMVLYKQSRKIVKARWTAPRAAWLAACVHADAVVYVCV